MSDTKLPDRLRASLRIDAINGDAGERAVCAKQMREAAAALEESAAALIALQRDTDAARAILAGGDAGSLPDDWTLPRTAEARMDDIHRLTWQVRDTCRRAEEAEARLSEQTRTHDWQSLSDEIAELEERLRALRKARGIAKRTGLKRSDAVRAKISAARKAAWADPAVRAKMSAAIKAALADPAVRAKKSAARKAALADPAVRAKISAARKAAWADPAVRAKMSAAIKAALADPAVRAKKSAASKAAWAAIDREKLAIKQTRTKTDGRALKAVPIDPLEAALFGRKRRAA